MGTAMAARMNRAVVRIFVVEDNPGDVYLLEKALNQHQITYELTRYADGEQAIKALSKDDCRPPDLILLVRIPAKANAFPKGSRTEFRADPEYIGA